MKELSDKNRPRKLEDIFREGMEEAETAPSDLLWSRIERNLNQKETGYYKQRMVWYQRLAAACVLFVLFAGAYLFFDARRPNALVAVEQQPIPGLAAGKPATRPATPPDIATAQLPEISGTAQKEIPQNEIAGVRSATPPQAVPKSARTSSHAQARERSGNAVGAINGDNASTGLTARVPLPQNASHAPNTDRTTADTGMLLPTIAGENLLATGQATAEYPANAGASPASLAPVLTWPGLGRLAALKDTIPGGLLTLAAAPVIMAEPEAEAPKRGSRWQFGGKYASQYFDQNIALANNQPMLANNMLVPQSMVLFASAGSGSYADALQEFDKETGSGFSFNTGISAAYQLNKHLDLETGLGYTQNVATTNTTYVFNNAHISSRYSAGNSAGWVADASKNALVVTGIPSTAFLATLAGGAALNQTAVTKTPAFDTQYRYRMLGIPVKVNYQTNRGKSFYFASMGMLTNLLVQAHVLSDSEKVPDLEYTAKARNSPFRNWHFAAVASAGKGFEVAPGLQLKAGLEATQYLTHLTQQTGNLKGKQHKPYTVGLALSSSYTFGK